MTSDMGLMFQGILVRSGILVKTLQFVGILGTMVTWDAKGQRDQEDAQDI